MFGSEFNHLKEDEVATMPEALKEQDTVHCTEDLETHYTKTEEVILKRRSVRLYKKKQVPEFMVKRILEAGRFAPSAGNGQPWKFIVIRDKDIIDAMTEDVVKTCKLFKFLLDYRGTNNLLRRMLAWFNIMQKPNDLNPTPFGAISLIADRKLALYHGAPTVILIFKDVRGIGSPDLDCGIAGQNMVLAAHSMGLGTCWVSFSKLAFEHGKKWRKKFNVAYPYKFISSIALGWPAGEPDGMVKRPLHDVEWFENGQSSIVR